MNSEKMNTWLTLITNFGVLVGIVFLAFEVQQNTKITKAQTRDAVTQKQIEWFRTIGTDPRAAEILRKGVDANVNPEAVEALSFNFLIQSSFRMWENEYYQYEMGLFDEAEFLPRIDRWKAAISRSPGRKQVWNMSRTGYSPEFRDLIDRLYTETDSGDDT